MCNAHVNWHVIQETVCKNVGQRPCCGKNNVYPDRCHHVTNVQDCIEQSCTDTAKDIVRHHKDHRRKEDVTQKDQDEAMDSSAGPQGFRAMGILDGPEQTGFGQPLHDDCQEL